MGDSTTRYNAHPNHLYRLKRVEILHHLISQPIFSEAFQTEWCEPFDCLNREKINPLLSKRIFRFFHVNGKYPRFTLGMFRLLRIVFVDDWDQRSLMRTGSISELIKD